MAICCCRICGPASPGCGPAPALPWSAAPPNAPTCCSNSSMPAATPSACPAICMTRRPNGSAGSFARSSPRIIAGGSWYESRSPGERSDTRESPACRFAHASYDGRESSSALVARDLRGQHVARRLDIDQRIDVKFGRYDIGPFVQDAVKLVVAFDIEHGGRATADARIDMLADTRSLVSADPGPEALSLPGDLGWTFRARRRDDEKQGGHDELLRR